MGKEVQRSDLRGKHEAGFKGLAPPLFRPNHHLIDPSAPALYCFLPSCCTARMALM